jgi:hypothetical protein
VAGQSANFTVTPAGTGPFTYQWLRNGVVIAGATSQTYMIASVAAADAGAYSVRVSNGAGTATSAGATLSVLTPVVFSTHPSSADINIVGGTTRILSVKVTGSGPFTYQWRKDGASIAGATLTSYTVAAGVAAGSAVYDVVVSNPVGSSVSNPVKVNTHLSVGIASQPSSLGAVLGRQALFSVTPSGTGPFTYQWMKNGVAIAGANGPSYSITSVVATDVGSYSVRVSNVVSSVVSFAATLSIVTPPSVVTQPSAFSKIQGQTVSFTVSVRGTTPLTYQWLKDGVVIPGAVGLTYVIPSVQPKDSGMYRLLISNSGGSVYSQEVSLEVLTVPVILSHPSSFAGEMPASKGYYPVLAYDFNTGTQGWSFGATAADRSKDSWSFGWDDPGNPVDGLLECDNFTGLYGDSYAKSPWISLVGVSSPEISFRANTYGGPGTLSVEASADGLIWVPLKSPVPQASGGSDTYTCSLNSYAGGGCYIRARLSGVNIAGVIDDISVSGYKYPAGASVQLVVSASGGGLSYQWHKDGVAIAGATSASYTVSDINQSGATGAYTVKVSNAAGAVMSSAATLSLLTPPVFLSQPSSMSRHVGQSGSFNVSVSSMSPVTYQWYKDGSVISGATGSTFSISSIGVNDGGVYKVRISSAAAVYFSHEATLGVAPAIFSQPTSFHGPVKTKALLEVTKFSFNPDLQGWVPEVGTNNLGQLEWRNYNTRSTSTKVAGKSSLGWYGDYQDLPSGKRRGFIYDGVTLTNIDYNPAHVAPENQGTTILSVTSTGMVVGRYGASGSNSFFTRKNLPYGGWIYGQYWQGENYSLGGAYLQYFKGGYEDALYGAMTYAGGTQGFIFDDNVMKVISYPGSYATYLEAASDGMAVGTFRLTAAGAPQQFYFDGVSYRTVSVPGALQTYLFAIGGGKIAGTYYDDAWESHGFVYDGVSYLTVDPPGKTADNFIRGIFDGGVVGTYYDTPTGFSSRSYGYERSGDLTRVIAVPVDPTQYSFSGLQFDNLSGVNGAASISSPSINLSGVSSSECAMRLRFLGGAPGDLVIQASKDKATWQDVFISSGQSGDFTFSLANFDGGVIYLRARAEGSYNLIEIETITISGVKYDEDPAYKLSVYAVGADCAYQWYKDGVSIAGANSSEFVVPDRYAAGVQGSYVVKVTNSAGAVTSDPAVIKLYSAPAVTSQPASQSIKGPTFSPVTTRHFDFSTGADGWIYGSYAGNASQYHWDWNASLGVISDRLFGATYASYTDTFTQSPYLSLAGVSSSGLAFSANHQLYVDGIDALQVQASLDGVNWSTLRNITGNGNTYYTVSLSEYDYLGCYIRFRLLTSSAYNSTGVNIDNVSITGLAVSVPGSPVTFSVSVSDPSACAYQWYKNDVAIAGATGSSYTISSVISSDAGSYNVKVTNPAGSTFSSYATLTVLK